MLLLIPAVVVNAGAGVARVVVDGGVRAYVQGWCGGERAWTRESVWGEHG